jgi:hypothetical protein
MVKKRGIRVQIIVEDETLERLVREVLRLSGFNRHELRVTPYPVGRGSAKAWVNRQYPLEVSRLRSRSYQNLAVVVGTDADEMSVQQRAAELADMLVHAKCGPRDASERIVLWIPKWNIETWLLYFAGDVRDEGANYKSDLGHPDFRACAQAFADEYRQAKQNSTLQTLPSLLIAYQEAARLES